MNKFVVWIMVVTFAQSTLARPAILAPGGDAIEFQGWLTTQSGLRAISETNELSAKEKLRFNKLLAQAQQDFLGGSLDEAKLKFTELTKQALKYDWPSAQRKAIHFAFLRLAQLTKLEEQRRLVLREAFSFAPDLKPDAKLFPPPLILEYSEVAAKVEHVKLRLDSRFEDYNSIEINGREFLIASTNFIMIPVGQHRLTLRSNVFENETIIVQTSELTTFVPNRKELVRGSCENPQIEKMNDAVIYFSKDCQYLVTKGKVERLSEATSPSSWKDFAVAKPVEVNFPEVQKPKKRTLLKSPWLWASVAAIAGVYLISQNSSREPSAVTPSSRSGY